MLAYCQIIAPIHIKYWLLARLLWNVHTYKVIQPAPRQVSTIAMRVLEKGCDFWKVKACKDGTRPAGLQLVYVSILTYLWLFSQSPQLIGPQTSNNFVFWVKTQPFSSSFFLEETSTVCIRRVWLFPSKSRNRFATAQKGSLLLANSYYSAAPLGSLLHHMLSFLTVLRLKDIMHKANIHDKWCKAHLATPPVND